MCCVNKNDGNLFILIILYWTCGTNGNYEVVWCQNTSLYISCDNNTNIEIKDVQFGPMSTNDSNIEGLEIKSDREGSSFNRTTFEAACNDRQNCYLNDSEQHAFSGHPDIPRLVNITYKCDFEYVGCYTDYEKRLFTGGSIEVRGNMSAIICRNFCSTKANNFPHFGTENGFECYCGFENDTDKFHRTYDNPNRTYNLKENDVCNYTCQGHPYEICGRHGFISVYTTTAAEKTSILKVEDVKMPTCRFNSTIKKIDMFSHQRSRQCERKEINNPNYYNCNENSCWVKQNVPFISGDLEPSLPKYVRINYTCIALPNNENEILTAVSTAEDKEYVGIVIGILTVVTLICGILVGLCLVRRNRQRSKHNGVSENRNNNVHTPGTDEYENVQRENNVYIIDKAKESKNKPTVVPKSKLTKKALKLGEDNSTFSSPDDVYVDAAEGVYDISNKPRYKNKNKNEGIYSHTAEGVYDITATNDQFQKDEENPYDKGFHQPTGHEYEI